MRSLYFILLLLISFPVLASAQSIQTFLSSFLVFLNGYVVPLLFALAFLFFIANVVRYFVVESSNEQGREKARALALYGVGAFVLFMIFYGMVGMLIKTIGIENETFPAPDYIVNRGMDNSSVTCEAPLVQTCSTWFGINVCRCK